MTYSEGMAAILSACLLVVAAWLAWEAWRSRRMRRRARRRRAFEHYVSMIGRDVK
jgi:Flp pilus assembly protein TadB